MVYTQKIEAVVLSSEAIFHRNLNARHDTVEHVLRPGQHSFEHVVWPRRSWEDSVAKNAKTQSWHYPVFLSNRASNWIHPLVLRRRPSWDASKRNKSESCSIIKPTKRFFLMRHRRFWKMNCIFVIQDIAESTVKASTVLICSRSFTLQWKAVLFLGGAR